MPRTIIYKRQRGVGGAEERPYGAPSGGGDQAAQADDYAGRLLKYIPAETIGFVAFAINVSDSLTTTQMVAIVALGGLGQLARLIAAGRRLDSDDRPSARQFAFAVIAYLAWVLGTCPAFDDAIGIDQATGAIALAATAYLLPAVDDEAHRLLDSDTSDQLR